MPAASPSLPSRNITGATRVAAPTRAAARVMVCDDSVVIRSAISAILAADPNIEVVARVADGRAAVDMLKRQDVDVVVLDIEMPIMDGLTALPLLLAQSPGLSIIMASSLTTRGAEISMLALRLGAADTLPKPSAAVLASDQSFGAELIAKVHGLTRLRRLKRADGLAACDRSAAPQINLRPASTMPARLLAIGSSTGGPNALFSLVQQIGPNLPIPIVLTQHMPASFTPILAQHLDKLGIPCAEARDGDVLLPGRILLAPGDRHLLVRRQGANLVAQLSDGPAENFCRPSVDPMLRSACEATAGRVLVTMLTGMGQDGLLGSKQVIEAGGALIAQDESTSVVWGMPGAVARAGLAHAVLPLPQIGAKLKAMLATGAGPSGRTRQ